MIEISNFMLCIFYHNTKLKKNNINMRNYDSMDTVFQFCKMKIVLVMDSGNVLKTSELYTLKWLG